MSIRPLNDQTYINLTKDDHGYGNFCKFKTKSGETKIGYIDHDPGSQQDKICELDETTPKKFHKVEAQAAISAEIFTKKEKIFLLTLIVGLLINIGLIIYNCYENNLLSDLKDFSIDVSLIGLFSLGIIALTIHLLRKRKLAKKIIENLNSDNNSPKPNALVLMTTRFSDWNHTFDDEYFDALGALSEKYNIDLIYPISSKHIANQLNEKPYDHVLFAGHGNPTSIDFTPSFSFSTDDVSLITAHKLTDNATVVLHACSTGSSKHKKRSLAYVFADQLQRTVIAPDEDCNELKYKITSTKTNCAIYNMFRDVANRFAQGSYQLIPTR